ncbi:MAG: hypothetical protein HOV81_03535 [Kofleriaceae bacterium]|nr:hypothetical protein [Kofleriaceae bacterium]
MRWLVVVLLTVSRVAVADETATKRAIETRFAKDPKAKTLAVELFADLEHVVEPGDDEVMDGGYRGKIHLVPELPAGRYRQQLAWVAAALHSIDAFFDNFDKAPSYRWRALTLRFVRSVGKRTPSAFASGWTITHNVVGSLLGSERGVRETYFHELFHLNDFDHGDWSAKTLAKDYAAIVKKCGTKSACLAPFAPNVTKVRATGTYYAFQPNNGDSVHEYAAELAVRYFKEQTEMAERGKLARSAFKCGPAENARAWSALVDEFFAGRDLVPSCTDPSNP